MRNRKPYLEFFRRLLKTEPYEEHITDVQSRLGKEGVKTRVFKGGLRNFLICMWTSGQREKLLKLAPGYEAVMVMGCEGAYQSVCDMIKSTDCRVFPGMESEGIMNAIPKFHFPFNISLELFNVTPVLIQKKE